MSIARTEPYALGYMSCCTGIPKIGNPYPTDSLEGWEAAKRESEEEE